MTKKEWQILHGFTDEDMDRVDAIKKEFNGMITGIFTVEQMKEINKSITINNQINIDRLWAK